LLLRSGIEVSQDPFKALKYMLPVPSEPQRLFVRTLAATQLILGIMAVTSYHVQIITRIASGYPVWYWWVANNLTKELSGWAWTTTVFMALYGSIQGGLFASFLPPA
jgi:phosphatidylinositol glycan class V